MNATAQLRSGEPTRPETPLLEAPFATPPERDRIAVTPTTERLVRTQVRSLLAATPSYHQLAERDQERIERQLRHIASYAAECLRDIYWQSDKLGQTPVLKETSVSTVTPLGAATASAPPRVASAQANDFAPRAADQIGRVTQQTLRAIAFPTFVADLIRGTFDAITRTNMQQMEAFSRLLSNVSKTVDQFMEENVSDQQAHEWLAQSYPRHLTLQGGRAVPRDNAGELGPPNFERDLHVGASSLDESSIEETLVPAARRRLAESRLQMLSTMVLMGINRIVITSGKIRATMGFHIDTSDSAFERTGEDVDARLAMRGHYNALMYGFEASASLAYVSSRRAGSDAEINVETDLTGEVELHFKSDYFPVERFATQGTLRTISNNTAVPEANPAPTPPAPATSAAAHPTFSSPRTRRRERTRPPELPAPGAAPAEPRLPAAPITRGQLDPNATRTPETPAAAPPAGESPAGAAPGADSQPSTTPAPTGEEGHEPEAQSLSIIGARRAPRREGLPWNVQ